MTDKNEKGKALPRSAPVSEIAAEEPKALQKESSLAEAAEKMRALDAEAFPVASGDRLVGQVEGKTVDCHAAGFGHDPAAVKVRENLSRDFQFCYEDQTVEEARCIMQEHGLRHLPVVDRELRIVGVLSLSDLA